MKLFHTIVVIPADNPTKLNRFLAGTCYLHPRVHFPGLYDRTDPVCGRGHR